MIMSFTEYTRDHSTLLVLFNIAFPIFETVLKTNRRQDFFLRFWTLQKMHKTNIKIEATASPMKEII